MSEKTTRKEMQAPDAFQRTSVATWKKLLAHRTGVLVLLGLVVVALVAAGIYDAMRSSSAKAAGVALADALSLNRRPVEGISDPAVDPELEKFPKLADKRQAIVEQLTKLITDHPSTSAALSATLSRADAYLQLGKVAEAQKDYRDYLDRSASEDPSRILAWEGLGYSFESQKAWNDALDSFGKMASEGAGEKGQALSQYHHARILEQSGKKAEAAVEFQKVTQTFKDAPAAKLSTERLATLAAQGILPPKTPTPPPAGEKK